MNKEVVQDLIKRSPWVHRETKYFRGYGDDPTLPQTQHPHIEFSPKPRTVIRITWEKRKFAFIHIQVMRIVEESEQVRYPDTAQFSLRVKTIFKGDIPLDRKNPDAFSTERVIEEDNYDHLDIDFIASILKFYKSFID